VPVAVIPDITIDVLMFAWPFNGGFRDECLNDHWFESPPAARAIISAWRHDYNEHRPHSALGYRTLAEVAALHRRIGGQRRSRNETACPSGRQAARQNS